MERMIWRSRHVAPAAGRERLREDLSRNNKLSCLYANGRGFGKRSTRHPISNTACVTDGAAFDGSATTALLLGGRPVSLEIYVSLSALLCGFYLVYYTPSPSSSELLQIPDRLVSHNPIQAQDYSQNAVQNHHRTSRCSRRHSFRPVSLSTPPRITLSPANPRTGRLPVHIRRRTAHTLTAQRRLATLRRRGVIRHQQVTPQPHLVQD